MPLDRVRARFAGADADCLLDMRYKYLAIADPPGLRRFADSLDRPGQIFVGHDNLDLHLGQEIDDIFGAAIEFGMALLAPESLGFGDSDALNAGLLSWRIFASGEFGPTV